MGSYDEISTLRLLKRPLWHFNQLIHSKRGIMLFYLSLPIIIVLATLKISYAQEEPSNEEMLHEIKGYAIASCLTKQKEAFLKDQGYRWAEAIIQSSSRYDFEVLLAISDAVKKEISKNNMFTIRDETTPYIPKALPIYYCYGIASKPSVQATALKVYTQLKS